MTQTLDVHGRVAELDSAHAAAAPISHVKSAFGTFAITYGISFTLLYTIYERLNWPLFTFHQVLSKLEFGRQLAGVGPPMFWYGWIALAIVSALIVALAATLIPEKTIVEPGSLWLGFPGKFHRILEEKDRAAILRYANNYLGYKESYLAERK